jgi:hypothetical protein
MERMLQPNKHTLPPLVLHPFALPGDSAALLDATKAVLRQHMPGSGGADETGISDRVLAGRYREMRWLFFIGRDVVRWIEQCLDYARRHEDLNRGDINFQAFATLITDNAPPAVRKKLQDWGVFDYRRIFSRALGLNAVFADFPPIGMVAELFIREYYRYLDSLFACRQKLEPHWQLDPEQVGFEVFTSDEYLKILESGLDQN